MFDVKVADMKHTPNSVKQLELRKVFQMGFDIEESPNTQESSREDLFKRIEKLINETPNFKSLGIFNDEDMTEEYKKFI